MDERILTCAYCGQEYLQDTPASGSEVLTEHIKVCERHPMRKAEADIALLRSALEGMIGASTERGLREMEAAVQVIPDPEGNATVALAAIRALLATMPPNV